jgi:SAM-dependent methyltransferase
MARPRALLIVLAAGAAAVALVRRGRRATIGRRVEGGILIGDAHAYDTQARWLLGPLFRGIAADVAATAPDGGRLLEVGCGPGHLSILLARDHGFDVTALDLDPAMIERARENAARAAGERDHRPSFVVGDVGALPFPYGSFDLVVSTLSMHHWDDPVAGLAEIGRVLRPAGRALLWDLRPGLVPFHRGLADPLGHATASPLRVVSATPWQWPWRLSFTQRIELARAEATTDHPATVPARARRGRSRTRANRTTEASPRD